MTTRIIFNGQEYASTEAMPEHIRNAYLEALAMLRDGGRQWYPRRARGWEWQYGDRCSASLSHLQRADHQERRRAARMAP